MLIRRALVALAASTALTFAVTPSAAVALAVAADPGVSVGGGSCPNGICGADVDVDTGNQGGGETAGGSSGGGDAGGSAASGEAPKCLWGGREIECERWNATWSNSRQCFWWVTDPQPDFSDPIWEGRTEGVIVSCMHLPCDEDGDGNLYLGRNECRSSRFWAAKAPDDTGPSARELADRAVESMALRSGVVGSAPPSFEVTPSSSAIVGMPVWLWVADPGESTTGPITRTASAGGVSVTATATLDRIVYDMGDGGSVTCRTPGTPWRPELGDGESPDCGYVYSRASSGTASGAYTVTATSYWTVAWSAPGQSGTIPVELPSTTRLRVGEVQVLLQ